MLSICEHDNELKGSTKAGNILISWVTTSSYVLAQLKKLIMPYVISTYWLHFTIHTKRPFWIRDSPVTKVVPPLFQNGGTRAQEANRMHCWNSRWEMETFARTNKCWHAITGCSVLHNYVRIRHKFRLEDILTVPKFEDESERNVSGDLQPLHPVAFNNYKISKTEFLLSMTINNFKGNYGPHSKGRVQQFLYCCVCIHCRGNVFLPSRCLAMIWRYTYGHTD
jgi:hypothetical protein